MASGEHDHEDVKVRAGGGVVVRERDGELEIALVHRPRYHDWSLPKGKLKKRDASWEDGALREVEEETGLRCELGPELRSVRYRDPKLRLKRVRYWLMEAPPGPHEFEPNDEVDELEWLAPEAAIDRLTWPRDGDVIRDAVAARQG